MSTFLLGPLAAALRDRYLIEREVGGGGMAVVYLATDLKHHRKVAVKVLRPELAASLGPERFLREIEVAAHLQHPHILPLFDSGRIDSVLYYVMPYVEGESLRGRLAREGQLAVEEALRLGGQVADALAHAHARGVVHRDVKPENILLESGHAVVADFGIARAIGAAGGEQLTATGLALGTPQYMSPEQAAGERDVDGRSDIYALGCVLYEMLAGTPPFAGATAQAVLARHALDPVPSLRTVRGTVPQAVEQVVLRALAKVPADRFANAEELTGALAAASLAVSAPAGSAARPRRPARRAPIVAGLAILAAGLIVGRVLITRDQGAGLGSDTAAPERMAILTFANLSPDTADAYLAQGIGEEIAARLGGVPGITVASRSTVGRLERAGVAGIAEQARGLRLRHLVEGSVRREGPRVRVSVRLVDAFEGISTPIGNYDRQAAGVFELQDEIAADVARAVAPHGSVARPEPGAIKSPVNPSAYDQLLRGNYALAQRNPRGLAQAVAAYTEAARLDAAFALAPAKLALAHVLLLDWGWTYAGLPPESLLARGRAAADRALRLDSTLADAWHAHGGLLVFEHPSTYAGVRQAQDRAMGLDAGNPDALHEYGVALRRLGDPAAAENRLLQALASDPDRPVTLLHLAWIAMEGRRWADARRWLDSATTVDPGFYQAYAERAALRLVTGDTASARADAETAVRLRPVEDRLAGESTLMALDRRGGNSAGVRARLARLRLHAPAPTSGVHDALAWAAVLIAAGENRPALEFLERLPTRGRPGREPGHYRIHLDEVHFDPIRGDPRFRRLREEMTVAEVR
jgi:serine/threonine-protein kinase